MFTLRIYLLGLVALVPDLYNHNLTIVVPYQKDHSAVVAFPCALPCASPCNYASDTPALAKKLGIEANLDDTYDSLLRASYDRCLTGYALKALKGVTISIGNLKQGNVTFVQGQRRRRLGDVLGGLPMTATEGEDFSWVPTMSVIRGSACHLAKKYLVPKPDEVQAVLDLQGVQGKVKTASLASMLEDPLRGCSGLNHPSSDLPVPFIRSLTFSRSKGSIERAPRQALADAVVVELKVTAQATNLVLGAETIALAPEKDHTLVEITIANLTKVTHYGCDNVPSHFDFYHEMSAEGRETRPKIPHLGLDMRRTRLDDIYKRPPAIKVLYDLRDASGGGGINRPICMLATYSR